MPRLVVGKGRSKGKFIDLPKSGAVVVGRDLNNELPIRDAQASRRHFKVSLESGTIQLEDLKSVNGTWVNGKRQKKVKLTVGDKIRTGETVYYIIGDRENQEVGYLTNSTVAGYKIAKLLGRGAMGHVYQATQLSLEREVAFKVLAKEYAQNQNFINGFLEEARFAGRLNHPNIVQVFDVGESDGTYFYSLELMENGSVEDLIRKDGPLALETILPIILDTARGLEYAEKQGLIHRDIKPANLFLSTDHITKIGDLGIAQSFETGSQASQDIVSGSPHYIAPEQALGKDIDHRADLYAFGVSIYEMVTGSVPFVGSSPKEIIHKHLEKEAPSIHDKVPDAPQELVDLVESLMAKSPDERPESAGKIPDMLKGLFRELPAKSTAVIRLQGDMPGPMSAARANEILGGMGPETARRPLPWKPILLLLAILATAGTIVFVSVNKAKKRHALRQQLRAEVDKLADLYSDDQFLTLKTQAPKLKKKIEKSGFPKLSSRVEKLVERTDQAIAEKRKLKFEMKAANALAILEGDARRFIGVTREPKVLGDLEQRVLKWLKEYPNSKHFKAGQKLRRAVTEAYETLVRFLKAKDAREAEFNENMNALKAVVANRLLQKKYGEALLELNSFRDKHSESKYIEAANAIEAHVREQSKREMAAVEKIVSHLLSKDKFAQAKALLNDFEASMKLPSLQASIDSVREFIAETVEARAKALASAKSDRDEERFKSANQLAKSKVTERDFFAAPQAFINIIAELETQEFQSICERRKILYQAADLGFSQLIKHINDKGTRSGITRTIVFNDNDKLGIAVEADKKTCSFEVEKGVLIPVKFTKIPRVELTDMLTSLPKAIKNTATNAALLWAIGSFEEAEQVCKAVKASKGEAEKDTAEKDNAEKNKAVIEALAIEFN